MDLTLKRDQYRADGIFGNLTSSGGELILMTLEHSYEQEASDFTAKIPAGSYICVRGTHQLAKAPNPFETFEVTGVVGHTDILFHPGNYNQDSEGCILLGTKIMKLGFGIQMIANSKIAFEAFMQAQLGLDSFWLTVLD